MLLAAVCAMGAAAPAHFDLDEPGAPVFVAGCGGALDDWEAARALDDPRDGSIRSVGGSAESCLVIPGRTMRDGVVSARITTEEGPAGFALRYRAPGSYLAITIDLGAGIAVTRQQEAGERHVLGTCRFPPVQDGRHRVMAGLAGEQVVIVVDGSAVCHVSGAAEADGGVALLAARRTLAEFDDIDLNPWTAPGPMLLDPLSPEPVVVGRPVDLMLRCLSLDEEDGPPARCSFELSEGAPPPGLELRRDGHLFGRPLAPGDSSFGVRVSGPGIAPQSYPVQLRVRAVTWPRFPFDPRTHARPSLAVLYTPDDIGPTATLKKLGSPDELLFRLHRDHPMLKVALMGCPNNRYERGATLADSPAAARVWKTLATDPAFDWVELGGHGYTHSPEGDDNLDHHEFSTTQTGCNIDHAKLSEATYCQRHLSLARAALRGAGIPDDRVVVMRFPGIVDSPEALRAAASAGFEAILGNRHSDEAGREWWVPFPGGEILEIENSNLTRCFSRSAELETALESGRLTAGQVASDTRFLSEVERGRVYVEQVAAQGGILNLFDHWWETFASFGGVSPRYLVLDAVLKDIESRYGERAWYPRARDLALWLEARRRSVVSWQSRQDGLHLIVDPPSRWKERGLSGIETASLLVHLPAGYTGVSGVRSRQGESGWQPLRASSWWLAPDGLAVTFPLRHRTELLVLPEELPGSGRHLDQDSPGGPETSAWGR